MTTFVDTSVLFGDEQAARDQDPVVVIVRSAQAMLREGLGETDSSTFEKNFAEAYANEEWARIFDLLLGNAGVVFKKVASADDIDKVSKTAEGYFEVTLSLLSKLESVEEVISKMNAFIETMLTEPRDALKLKLLTTLFSTLNPKAQLRLVVAKGLCKFASRNSKFGSQVFALVKDCETWMNEFGWEVSEAEQNEIFGLIASVASGEDKLRYLSLQAAVSGESQRPTLLNQIAIETIREPSAFSTSVECKDDNTRECLRILSQGSFADMEAFVSKNAAFIATHNLQKDQILDKMRVMALARLASSELKKSNRSVSIAVIGDSLKTAEPVDLIIRTIRAGLILGSVDEVSGNLQLVAAKNALDAPSLEKDLKKIQQRLSGL
jgi:hypothetical protein